MCKAFLERAWHGGVKILVDSRRVIDATVVCGMRVSIA